MSMTWDTTTPQQSSGSGEVLPTDIYIMKIAESVVEEDKFGKPDREGKMPKKLVLRWETERLTAEQEEAGMQVGEAVWQRLNPYYGTVKEGGPSKFMAFVDSLKEQGMLGITFSVADFVGIIQRVSVEEYIKTMGTNAGSPGNRVTAVAPIKPQRRNAPRPIPAPVAAAVEETEEELGF